MPELIPPMLAAAGPLPAGGSWAFEFKYDGVRAVGYVGQGLVRVMSRNNIDVTATYPELATLGDLLGNHRAIVDGEIVALAEGDRPSFARLAARIHVARPAEALLQAVPVVYYVFDLLWLDGISLLNEPYEQRRQQLSELCLTGTAVRTPPSFTGVDGTAILRTAELAGLEGVIAKRLGSVYRPGRRSESWTKVPLIRTQEVVIVGWKPGQGRRAGTIGSLLLGVLDEAGALQYAGNVGTGFTDVMLGQLRERLTVIQRRTAPVPGVPRVDARHARWVDPVLTGEVAYRNWTPDGRMRHPSWRGLRADRSPAEAKRELVGPSVPAAERVTGAMVTSDGRVRVEVVDKGGLQSFRVLHRDNVLVGLDISGVEALLAQLGIKMDALKVVDPPAAEGPSEVIDRLPA
jgi:bifunctional non-homologous end joining protein LigD